MFGLDSSTATTLAVIGLVIVLVIVVIIIVKRYRIAGPSEAIIVTGRGGKTKRDPATGLSVTDYSGQRVVLGGGIFVLPFVQSSFSLSLASRRISIRIDAISQNGIRLNLDAVAIVKVGGTDDLVRAAAQRFLQQQDEIEPFTQEVLAGALRSIVGTLTVDQIIRDRAAFATRVAEESEGSLTNQGLVLDTFQIQGISDDANYLRDLGRPEAAQVQRVAAVAEASARQEAEQANIRANEQIANAQRDLQLRKAAIKAETDAADAQAAAAGPLAEAAREQDVLSEQEKVAERRAALKERQLDTEVRKPADADRYRIEQEAQAKRSAEIAEAEARKAATVAAAEAQAEQTRLSGRAELERRQALAKAVQLEGEAEAAAILATGTAEAEAMTRKADALKQYGDAAVTQMVVEALPEIAKELASPMAAIKDLTVISTDGATQLSRNITDNLVQTLEMVKKATGIDATDLIARASGKTPEPPTV